MSNEIGSALLTSINKGSYDVNQMAKVLAEADIAGPKAMIERKQDKNNSELNALHYLSQNLTAFNTYTQDLASHKIFNERSVSSTDESVVSATITGKAAAGTYNIESMQLASAHTLLSDAKFASRSAALGEGTVKINDVEIAINSNNNTLEGLQNAINDSAAGVSAAIIKNGGQYQLMLTSKETGEASEFDVTGDLSSILGAGASFSTAVQAQDAELKLNGVTITNSTNNFDDLIEGVNFNLKSAKPGTTQTIEIQRGTEAAKEAIQDFVLVYNQLDEILKDMSSYQSLTKEQQEEDEYEFYGSLAGSSMLRELRSQIKESLMGTLGGSLGAYNSLAGIGIEIDRFGKLQLDEDKLDNALATSMDSVAQLFARGGTASDSFVSVSGGSDKTQEGSYALNITQMAAQASAQGDAISFVNDEVTLNGASFSLAVDDSKTVTISLADGTYTREALADLIQNTINSNSDIKASNARALVSIGDDNKLNINSERFGGISKIELSNFSGMADLGFADGAEKITEFGQNIDGTLTDENGVEINIGAYADSQDGRKFKISDFAVGDGKVFAGRGLEFEVSGGEIGDRGTIEFKSGFASKLYDTVNNALKEEEGLIGQRVTSLNETLDRLEESQKKLDLRYEKLEKKYQMQFSLMNQIMSQMQETQSFLFQTYNSQ